MAAICNIMKAIYQYIINIMTAICNNLNAMKCSAVWLRRVHRIAQRGQSSTLAQVFSSILRKQDDVWWDHLFTYFVCQSNQRLPGACLPLADISLQQSKDLISLHSRLFHPVCWRWSFSWWSWKGDVGFRDPQGQLRSVDKEWWHLMTAFATLVSLI